MNISARLTAAGLMGFFTACAGAAPVPASSPAASEPASDTVRAGERCEAAVAETLRRMRGKEAQDVQFVGAKRAISPTPQEELGVKGEGRYGTRQGSTVPFTYSCAFNVRTGGTSGVVLREDASARSSAPAWQPDLTRFSPEACEAATAAALKEKYPRAGTVAFDSGSRQLHAAGADRTDFEGRGAFVRAPGMNSLPFSFRCEFETATGKVFGVQTRE